MGVIPSQSHILDIIAKQEFLPNLGTCKQESRNVTNDQCASKWMKKIPCFIHAEKYK
jgi:hypothetical protein